MKKLYRSLAISLLLTCAGCDVKPKAELPKDKELTLAIIKPDAVENRNIGEIITHYEASDLNIAAIRMVQLDKARAQSFYAVHKGRPFYNDLVDFMSSGPIVAIVLEGKGAIEKNRKLIGATDPKEADAGTLRRLFATSKGRNAVHGSDSPEAARNEILFFFTPEEIVTRATQVNSAS